MICLPFSFFLFFVTLCSVFFCGSGTPSNNVQSAPVGAKTAGGEMSCYVCNSATKDEADCKEDDHAKLKPFLKKCPPLNFGTRAGQKAMACRKVRQTVEDETAVVRECAYSDEELDGKRRTGNKAVTVLIDQCINANATIPCNSALSFPVGATSSLLTTLFLMVLAVFLTHC